MLSLRSPVSFLIQSGNLALEWCCCSHKPNPEAPSQIHTEVSHGKFECLSSGQRVLTVQLRSTLNECFKSQGFLINHYWGVNMCVFPGTEHVSHHGLKGSFSLRVNTYLLIESPHWHQKEWISSFFIWSEGKITCNSDQTLAFLDTMNFAVGNNGQFQAEQYGIFLKTAQLCCISENKMIKSKGKTLGLKRWLSR